MRTIVYIDGFNLYYGSLRDTPYRWVDLGALCSRLLPKDQVVGIKYFTAKVGPRPWKKGPQPKTSAHQELYLRALATVPNLTCHYGHFLTYPVASRLVKPPRRGHKRRLVWKTEEKGSDVNLASHLLIDGFRARYDLAVVMSNDGDLKEPVHFVRHELNAQVGVLNPHPNRSWALSPKSLPRGSFYKPIRAGALASSQFPAAMQDARGSFQKPSDW